MATHHVVDPERARWILLIVGLAALLLAGAIVFVIQRLRSRYRAGRAALDGLRGGARGMHLQMAAAAEPAGAQLVRQGDI